MLEGIRVVEYATYIAAPGCAGILADWGAEVIKVEPPGGDPIRKFFDSIGRDAPENPVFDMDNRGKRSIVLDTAQPAGKAALLKLVAQADVLITNVRPSGLKRAGLDHETVAALNPRLVYASVTGYGLEGPDADRPGFDITAFWARSGMARLLAPKGTEPFVLRTGMGDHITSVATAAGVLAALVERNRTGKGRLVEASLLRSATYALASDLAIALAFGRVASTRPRHEAVQPLANFFQSSDGHWFVINTRQGEADWKPFCRAIGREDIVDDARFAKARVRAKNVADLVSVADVAFGAMTLEEIGRRLDAESIAWAPAQTGLEAVADPQLAAAGGLVDVPRTGAAPTRSLGAPVRFPGADDGPKGPPPSCGQHTRAVLSEAGYSEAEIAELLAAGAAQESA